MEQSNFELKLSFVVILFLGAVYIGYELVTAPDGGHPFGHALGILGAVLMLMTEILYSARKRLSFVRVGRVRHWLSFHIFTGITGPALVLMHTGLEFRGLAGFTMFLTVLVVASGFLGRYIYTAVPRTMAGIEVDRRTLELEIAAQQAALRHWSLASSDAARLLIETELTPIDVAEDLPITDVLLRRVNEWRENRRVRRSLHSLAREEAQRAGEIEAMLRQQRRLQRQIRSLSTVRSLMGLWHTAHIPIGLTLFVAMFIHIFATIYYGAIS